MEKKIERVGMKVHPAVLANASKIHDTVNSAIATDNYVAATMAMTKVLEYMGVDLTDENFLDTPHRFVKYLAEFMQGQANLEAILSVGFSTKHKEYHGMVTERNIPYRGMCAHHLLPFLGVAHIGYIPHKKVPGLSKIPRLVDAIATMSPGIQELHTDEIADAIYNILEPKGVIVVTDSKHTCMGCRGVRTPGVDTAMSTVRGVFRDVPAAREEFFSIIRSNHVGL